MPSPTFIIIYFMGMDLIPVAPNDAHPRHPMDFHYAPFRGKPVAGRYNWSGWSFLIDKLEKWGVNTDEFDGMNDGKVISDETCKKVADAIEQHLPELTVEEQWLKEDIALWRNCGGYEQC